MHLPHFSFGPQEGAFYRGQFVVWHIDNIIERRVQLNAEKNRMFIQITNSRKKQRHTMCKFVFRENNVYQLLALHRLFRCIFSDQSQKAIVISSLSSVPGVYCSLLCLNLHVLHDIVRVVFW